MKLKPFKITLGAFLCLFLALAESNAQENYNQKQLKVALRMIGHKVLLSLGDSSSQVLPIVQNNNSYKLSFDTQFELRPEELVAIANQVIQEAKIPTSYVVEVENCETNEIVYSYKMGNQENLNIIPCQGRALPKSCYNFLFTLNPKKEVAQLSSGSSPKRAGLNTYITILSLFILGILTFFLARNKRKKPTNNPNLIPLGKYHFDKHNTALLFEEQTIDLTSKEGDLLLLLYNSANTTVEREVILNSVWGDKGDYIGRTLDVFISKLRKKLQADSSIKIVNTRGVGYKLLIKLT